MSDPWWLCTHDGIGLPGCPTCDPFTYSRHGRPALVAARDEIHRQRAEIERLRAVLDDGRGIIAEYAPGFTVWLDFADATLGGSDAR